MRRSVALMVALLIGGLLPSSLPISPRTVVAGDGSPSPSVTLTPEPSTPPVGDPTVEPSEPVVPEPATPEPTTTPDPTQPVATSHVVAPAAATPSPSLTWIYNAPVQAVLNVPIGISIDMNSIPDGGILTLYDDGEAVGTESAATWIYGNVLWTPSTLGAHTLTAEYSGTSLWAASASTPVTVNVVNPQPGNILLSVDPNPVMRNATISLSATVLPDPGAGSIEFRVGGTLVATAALDAGVAATTTSISNPGTYGVIATFIGNSDWSALSSSSTSLKVNGDPITLQVTVPADRMAPGDVVATATLGFDPGGGTLQWSVYPFGSGLQSTPVGPGGVTQIDLGNLTNISGYGLSVSFSGYGPWAPVGLTTVYFWIVPASTVTLTASRSTATVGELPVVLTATASTPSDYSGTVTFLDDVDGAVVEFGPTALDSAYQVVLSKNNLRLGTHTIRAQFNGNNNYLPSTSDPVTVVVSPDTAVHATFSASLPSFYPYADGYRDKVSLGGVLDETATVTIRIYTKSGSLKRTYSLGSKSAGKFATSWNGKSSSGTAVTAGKYTVKALFKDKLGHTRTIIAYTTVSWRQVRWISVAATRYGDQLTYYATDAATHLYYSPDYSRGRTMVAGDIDQHCTPNCSDVWGAMTFGLVSAALDYRQIVVKTVGHGYQDYYNSGYFFLVNPTTGTRNSQGALPEYLNLPTTLAVPKGYVANHHFTFLLWCTQDMGDAFDVHYTKISYQYAVWK